MPEPKTLVQHAQYELEKADLVNNADPEARKIASDTLALVKRFEKQNHSKKTGKWVLEFFQNICWHVPLTPLTDDPDEWEKFDVETKNTETDEVTVVHRWQSRRSPSIISEDLGKTFVDIQSGKEGISLDHVEEEAKRAQDKIDNAKAIEDKKLAAEAAKNAPTGEPENIPEPDEAPEAPVEKPDTKKVA